MEKLAPNFTAATEDIGPCKKRLKIEVPKEIVEEELKKRLEELKESVTVPGFRKGKAPKSIIERQYAKYVQEDARNHLLNTFYHDAIEQNKLEPIGEPEFTDIDFDPSRPLTFQVTFEVKPTFELEGYKGVQLFKKSSQVTSEELESAITRVSLRETQLVPVEDGEVLAKDQALCDYEVEIEGKTVHHEEEVAVWVAGRQVKNIHVPDLVKFLVGARVGEKREIMANLGRDFPVAEYRNKEATLKLSIKEIKRPKAPEINDALAQKLGFPDLAKMKEAILHQLKIEKKQWVQKDLENQALTRLLEMANFDLPKDWIQRQAIERVYRSQLDLLRHGIPLEEIEKKTEELKETSEENVIKDLKIYLILKYIADKERIYVIENEVESKINELARAYGATSAKIRRYMEKQGTIPALRQQIREDKVISFLLKEANITEENQEEVVKKE
jgi:trigger factor